MDYIIIIIIKMNFIVPNVILSIDILMSGWMNVLRFVVPLNGISVISGRCVNDNERLCAVVPRLWLRRFRLERGSNPGPLDQ